MNERRAAHHALLPDLSGRADAWSTIAAVGAAIYVLILVALPFLEPSFDVLRSHPEDYASGPVGLAVNASYVALAVALVSFAGSVLPVRGWAIAVPALFLPAAALCVTLAVDPIGVAGGNALWLLPIFGLALAPMIGSLSLRDTAGRWRLALIGIAIVVLLTFGGVLTVPDAISGIVNRAFDVSVGSWILVAALAALQLETRNERGIS